MTVTLNRTYGGAPAGAVRDLPTELEAALVAQRIAVTGGTLNTGAQTTEAPPVSWGPIAAGVANLAIGAGSVAISNPNITAQSKAVAVIAQAAADGTALYVARAHCTAGVLTIYTNAVAAASTRVSYVVFP